MPELLDEIMDEAAALLGDLEDIRQQSRDAGVGQEQLARLKRRAARITNMLQAVELKRS